MEPVLVYIERLLRNHEEMKGTELLNRLKFMSAVLPIARTAPTCMDQRVQRILIEPLAILQQL